MKSQLMTALSIVGVLGTATTAMAVNTDVLANVDQVTAGTATDTLLPDPAGTSAPASGDVPTATPAPSEQSDDEAMETAERESSSETETHSSSGQSRPAGQTPANAPAVQTPASPVVNGTTGGSGSRVAPAVNTPTVTHVEDHDEDGEHGDEHGEVDDD